MKVSVAVVTYNHENYIIQALDSILMQKVNFDYEIIIGEDCSTDRTRDIVLDYHKKYPSKIRLLLHKQNVGAMLNAKYVHQSCLGDYVMWHEGDDYWTCPYKLQKQVDFLDHHPQYFSCFHPVTVFYEDGSCPDYTSPYLTYRRDLCLEDILQSPIISTNAFMHRNHLLHLLPDWYYDTQIGDWEFYIFAAQQSKIGYIDDNMATYRTHDQGCYTGLSSIEKLSNRIWTFEHLNVHLECQYDQLYNQLISECYYALAIEYANIDDLSTARSYFNQGLARCPLNRRFSRKNLIKLLLRVYADSFYRLIGLTLQQNPSLL